MKFPIALLDNLVAIRPGDPFELKSRIRLPDWQRVLRGTVIATGPKVTAIAADDVVVFGAAKGVESVFDGKPLRIMREDDVDGVLLGE